MGHDGTTTPKYLIIRVRSQYQYYAIAEALNRLVWHKQMFHVASYLSYRIFHTVIDVSQHLQRLKSNLFFHLEAMSDLGYQGAIYGKDQNKSLSPCVKYIISENSSE
jgi:hypothetical protein